MLEANVSFPTENHVIFPVVYYDGEIFHMWYWGYTGGFDGDIGYATSYNGYEWTKYGNNPVLSKGETGTWDSYSVALGSVIREDEKYRMWFTATASSGIFELQGTAISLDGITWEKYVDPIFEICEGETQLWVSNVVKSPEDYYYMWYTQGAWSSDGRLDIRYAYSLDGMQWTQFPGHTVLEKGVENHWDHLLVGFPYVMYDEETDTYKMWYFGSLTDPLNYMIGYAEAPNPMTVGNIDTKEIIPREYKLSQNYPNPFNPTTTIMYQISSDIRDQMSMVKLLVYDVLGREVVTLVDEQKNPGEYEVKWDASNQPSGIYFYKLQTGEYTNVKKMILLK